MDTPVTFHLQSFDGPLELLLHLVTVNKVDIMDIPVALILDQYIDYLDKMMEADLEVTCEFVAMAARLVYIKTRMLLPKKQEAEEEDPRAQLSLALAIYKKVKEAAPLLASRIQAGRDYLTKLPEQLDAAPARYSHKPGDLARAARNMFERAARKMPPRPETFSALVNRDPVPVEEKTRRIMNVLDRRGSVAMRSLYAEVGSRSELIAVFLALLELLASRRIAMDDDDGIMIYQDGSEND